MYICLCRAVTEQSVRQACESGASTLEDLQDQLGVATGCGQCADAASNVLTDNQSMSSDTTSGRYINAGNVSNAGVNASSNGV